MKHPRNRAERLEIKQKKARKPQTSEILHEKQIRAGREDETLGDGNS